MSDWKLAPNLAYRGKKPRRLKAACHDKTPFVTIEHTCGGRLHFHESQVRPITPDTLIVAACPVCNGVIEMPASFAHGAFDQLRRDGWI